jgi:hypothetical protein
MTSTLGLENRTQVPYHTRTRKAFLLIRFHAIRHLGTFDYTFGNYTIKVSFQDSLYKDDVDGTCTFGFTLGPQGEGLVPHILADAFMRGAYMVFDMDNDEI